MARTSNAAEKRYLGEVARMQCVICVRFEATGLPTEVHHVAEGSSSPTHWLTVPLCGSKTDGGHHRGEAGLHGMGVKGFCSFYRVPHGNEYGLLAWVNEDRQTLKGDHDERR
jgi:hypothetical protein